MDIDGNPIGSGSDQSLDSGSDVSFKSALLQELKLVNDGQPTPPQPGTIAIYSKQNNKLYTLDSDGKEAEIGGSSTVGGSSVWLFSDQISGPTALYDISFSNAVPANVNQIAISKTDFNSVSQAVLLGSLTSGDQLFLTNDTVGAKLYTLISTLGDAGTYFIYNVTLESQDSPANYAQGSGITVDAILQNPWNQQLNTTNIPTFAGLRLNGSLNSYANEITTSYVPINDVDLTNKLFVNQQDTLLQNQIITNDTDILALQNEDINLQTQINNATGGTTSGLALKMDKIATTPLDMNSNDITNVNSIYLIGTDTIFENGVVRPKIYTENNGNTTNSTSVGKTSGNIGVVTGLSNSAFGERALEKVTTGGQNTGVGNLSMFNLNTGSGNTSVGHNTIPLGTSSLYNTCIGGSAGGNLTTGENNVCIGYNTQTGTGDAQNRIIIGKDALGTTDNECVIGNTSLTSIRAGGINCDLGTAVVPYKDVYLTGTLDCNAVTLPTGNLQTTLDTKMFVNATESLNMNLFNINQANIITAGRISSITNSSTNMLLNNTDITIQTSNTARVIVDNTGLTVNQDASVGGILKVDTIQALTGSPPTPLVQDDFTGASLKNGGALLGFNQPGFPVHDVGNAWVQMTNDQAANATGYLNYTDPNILSSIAGATEWYCKFTGFFTDSDGGDGQVFFVHQHESAPVVSTPAAVGYSMLFFSNLGTTMIFYQNVIVGRSDNDFPALNVGQNYLIEWKIVKSGSNTTFTMYLNGVAQPNPRTDTTPRVFTTNYVGVGAYTSGTTTLAANYFFKDVEIDTVPSSGVVGTGVVTVDSDLNVGGVLQDTAADAYGQVSSGLSSFSIPLTATYSFLNSTTASGLVCTPLLFGGITHVANTYQLNVTDAGVYQINANISTKPASDNAIVYFTVFTRLVGVDTATEFQSVGEKLNGRFSNQTISALIELQAGESILLAMKSVNANQTSIIQFLSMNIMRIKTSI